MKALQYSNWSGKYSVACCALLIADTPHNKNKILIADILELEGLEVSDSQDACESNLLTAALITPSLTLSVRRAIIMIIFSVKPQ